MKKIAIFFFIIIIIVVGIAYMYLNYKAQYNEAKRENKEFASYYNQEIYGNDLTTIINKAIDNNKLNQVEQDENKNYINNNKNSINIDIRMLDDDNNIYKMETIFNGGMENFIKYYSQIKFKCTRNRISQFNRKSKIYVI